jgi:hypothetical protein
MAATRTAARNRGFWELHLGTAIRENATWVLQIPRLADSLRCVRLLLTQDLGLEIASQLRMAGPLQCGFLALTSSLSLLNTATIRP